ncbi:PRTRC system ThiF family protein [Chitinophaga sp. NPDC101104]|uniref:PRTRC system ThiF family protein n=1 Tax=Chitinophaga sp. NPDC101104 TaxID=3390561 RepID=UPI003D04C0C8
MKKIHFTDTALLHPTDAITVNIIGAGGTGSHLAMALADVNCALYELDHPGVHVRLFDHDKISAANLARQRFSPAEINQHKASAIISRINRYYGYNWEAIPEAYGPELTGYIPNLTSQITFSCVDTVVARQMIAQTITGSTYRQYEYTPKYWIDCGNNRISGQIWCATAKPVKQPEIPETIVIDSLPFITDVYGDELVDGPSQPSCSVREALLSQDLFINRAIALAAANFFWKMLRKGKTESMGLFYNADDARMLPIPLPEPKIGTNKMAA